MKKAVIGFIVFTLFTFGTALASPESQTLNQRIQKVQKEDIVFADFSKIIIGKQGARTCSIGFIDVSKIMGENPKAKEFQDQLNQLGKQFTSQLEVEKTNLTPMQFKQKQEELYGEFMKVKKEMEDRIDANVRQAIEKVAKEKNLVMVLSKMSTDIGTIDVTLDVMNYME